MTKDSLLEELKKMNEKLDQLILLISVQNKEEKEIIKILKAFSKSSGFSKRELERITGVDRHKF